MKDVKIFGSIVDEEARQQIEKLANYEPYKDAKIRIMTDVHAGKGCTIGTTGIQAHAGNNRCYSRYG